MLWSCYSFQFSLNKKIIKKEIKYQKFKIFLKNHHLNLIIDILFLKYRWRPSMKKL